jgi:homopolymeric O-antigen transport system permease protein
MSEPVTIGQRVSAGVDVWITPPGRWAELHLGDVWAYRELVYFLVWRDLKVRYKQTALGVAWAVLQPLVTVVIFTIIFGRLAGLSSEGVPYPVFALAALLPWQLFSAAVSGSSNSLVGSANLLTKVYFPRLIIPIAAVVSTLADFIISSALLGCLMLWYAIVPGVGVFLLPIFVVQALALALAIGLWASALNVQYRDVQYALPFALQVLLFASPVAYSAALVPQGPWRILYALNPLVGVIQGFRWALLGAASPGPLAWFSVLVTLAVLVGGLFFFKRMEDRFADLV